MTPQFAVNYAVPTADLVRGRQVEFDYFKCPAWPGVIAAARQLLPIYVHFPYNVGLGIANAMDAETNRPVDWDRTQALLTETGTPLVNVHLALSTEDAPDIPMDSSDPAHSERIGDNLVRDVRAVVNRFGARRVVIENGGMQAHPAMLPEVICRVTEETGCGLLLDVSHAVLAARSLGLDAQAYVSALPVQRIREIHITGVQRYEGQWIERAQRAGVEASWIQRFTGQWIDHLPMADGDWAFFAWVMDQVHSGAWGQPWVVTFEYGGVGPWFESVTDANALLEQIPRLRALIQR